MYKLFTNSFQCDNHASYIHPFEAFTLNEQITLFTSKLGVEKFE